MFRSLLLLIAVDNPLLVGKQRFQGNLVVLPFVAFSYTKIPFLHNYLLFINSNITTTSNIKLK